MCELSKRLRAQAAQAERLSQTVGDISATRTLKALSRQYEAEAEALEKAESLAALTRQPTPEDSPAHR